MKFSGKDLMNRLWSIYIECGCHLDATYQVYRKELEKWTLYEHMRYRNEISILIRDGFLEQDGGQNQDCIFSCRFTQKGIEAINEMAQIISSSTDRRNIPYI